MLKLHQLPQNEQSDLIQQQNILRDLKQSTRANLQSTLLKQACSMTNLNSCTIFDTITCAIGLISPIFFLHTVVKAASGVNTDVLTPCAFLIANPISCLIFSGVAFNYKISPNIFLFKTFLISYGNLSVKIWLIFAPTESSSILTISVLNPKPLSISSLKSCIILFQYKLYSYKYITSSIFLHLNSLVMNSPQIVQALSRHSITVESNFA